ncbi:MAG TPA: IS607 family element RNA-guided endonuclease TnpB [bacterium]|nr:IS607 family element RNA-guided endonuclease TnpB [bacterium]
MRVLQAYRYAVAPSPPQGQMLRSHVGAKRFAFNWGLALVQSRLEARARGEVVMVPWTMRALRNEWNCQKATVGPWWRENSKEAYNAGFEGLANALHNFFHSRQGTRRGRRMAFPVFRKRGRGRQSVRFTTGAIRVVDRTHIQIPRIGVLRTHEATSALLAKLEAGTARILAATVSLDGDRWQVSFTCEVERDVRRPPRLDTAIGVDAGLGKTVLSNGEVIPTPRPLKTALNTIARLGRRLSRCTQGGTGWQKTKCKLRRAHARVRHIREDATHKLTRRLATSYGTVVAEHLGVSAMMRSPRMGRAIADAGMAALRRQLIYKCCWYGSRFVAAPRTFPSSKTCSRCGAVKATLPLWVRVFRCDACGLELDRDLNAAKNLAALAAQVVAGSGPETRNVRGGDVSPAVGGQASMKRKAGPRTIGVAPSLRKERLLETVACVSSNGAASSATKRMTSSCSSWN